MMDLMNYENLIKKKNNKFFMVEVIRLEPKSALTPKGEFLKRLITGTAPREEKIAEAKKLAVGAAITGAAVGAALAPVKILTTVGRLLVPKTLKQALIIPPLAGAISIVPSLIDPRKTFAKGQELGKIIEDPSKLLPKDKPATEKIKEVAKAAGLLGGAAAVVAAAVPVVTKLRAGKPPAATLPTPLTLTPRTQPLGAAQPTPKEAPITKPQKPPSIKITNNPVINIRFSKSRKFINQQLLIK